MRAHAASEPQSWALDRVVFINITISQPGELIRATLLWLSKMQLDSKVSPQSLGLSGAFCLWLPGNRFLQPAPSPLPPPPSCHFYRLRQGSHGSAGESGRTHGKKRALSWGLFLEAGGRRGGWISRAARDLGLWGRYSRVSNTCSVTVTASVQEL